MLKDLSPLTYRAMTRRPRLQDALMFGPHEDVEKENARLRKENRLLRGEREVVKKATIH